MLEKLSVQKSRSFLLVIMVLAALARIYGINDPWKRNDHYNWGGQATQSWLYCLSHYPIEESRGLLYQDCGKPEPLVYDNYVPVFIWGIWLLSLLFGPGEWVLRSFHLIWSVLNIFLVYKLGRKAWPEHPSRWVTAAFFQAFFLSGLYFGTHPDPVTEFTLTWMLLSSLAMLSGKPWAACAWALWAGITNWVGYFQFPSLLVYAWARKRNLKEILIGTGISAAVCFVSIMWIKNTWNILEFLKKKMLNPEYVVKGKDSPSYLTLPFRFVKNFIVSQSRMLGPLFASFALYELFVGPVSAAWTWKREKLAKLGDDIWVIVLAGIPGFAYLIPGHQYAMVHIHNYVFLMPMFALLATRFVHRLTDSGFSWTGTEVFGGKKRRVYAGLLLLLILIYPYGIYQSRFAHDVANSLVLSLTSLAFLWRLRSGKLNPRNASLLLIVAASANFSQMVNYRNEKPLDYEFCVKAREEYGRTGQPVRSPDQFTLAKNLYCRDVPILYESP